MSLARTNRASILGLNQLGKIHNVLVASIAEGTWPEWSGELAASTGTQAKDLCHYQELLSASK